MVGARPRSAGSALRRPLDNSFVCAARIAGRGDEVYVVLEGCQLIDDTFCSRA